MFYTNVYYWLVQLEHWAIEHRAILPLGRITRRLKCQSIIHHHQLLSLHWRIQALHLSVSSCYLCAARCQRLSNFQISSRGSHHSLSTTISLIITWDLVNNFICSIIITKYPFTVLSCCSETRVSHSVDRSEVPEKQPYICCPELWHTGSCLDDCRYRRSNWWVSVEAFST